MERFTSSALPTLLILTALCVQIRAQNPPVKQNQPVDVIRINTELIQTGVIVLDKQGHFVDGLPLALTLGDVVFRRTEIGSAGHPGRATLETVAGVLATELRWDPQRIEREIADVESRYGVRGMLSASRRTC